MCVGQRHHFSFDKDEFYVMESESKFKKVKKNAERMKLTKIMSKKVK